MRRGRVSVFVVDPERFSSDCVFESDGVLHFVMNEVSRVVQRLNLEPTAAVEIRIEQEDDDE